MASIEQSISTYQQALNLRVQRHQVLASNIANADTPHYKARDLDFDAAMQNFLAGKTSDGGLGMSTTAKGHIADNAGVAGGALRYRKETQSAVDGNTVDMDIERSQIADNALQYQVLTQLIADQFKGLRSALASTNS